MSNKRVYELARDIGITSKALMEELRSQGIEVKSHMSTLDTETAELITDIYRDVEVTVVHRPRLDGDHDGAAMHLGAPEPRHAPDHE